MPEEIDRDVFNNFKQKFIVEQAKIERNPASTERGMPSIEKAICFASNPAPSGISVITAESSYLNFQSSRMISCMAGKMTSVESHG